MSKFPLAGAHFSDHNSDEIYFSSLNVIIFFIISEEIHISSPKIHFAVVCCENVMNVTLPFLNEVSIFTITWKDDEHFHSYGITLTLKAF